LELTFMLRSQLSPMRCALVVTLSASIDALFQVFRDRN